MGLCLSGSHKIGHESEQKNSDSALLRPVASESTDRYSPSIRQTLSRASSSRSRSRNSNRLVDATDDIQHMAVTESSSRLVGTIENKPESNGAVDFVKSSSLAKNRKYLIFDRSDLILRLNALNKVNSDQTLSEGTGENCLKINNYKLYTKPKRRQNVVPSKRLRRADAVQRDELSTPSAGRPASMTSLSHSPSSPSEFSYQNGNPQGLVRSDSRNTNTIASSPVSLDRAFLKVPVIPQTSIDGIPPKKPDSGSGIDIRPERYLSISQRNRSNTIDSGTAVITNPELFKSIKESTSVTRDTNGTGYIRLNQYLLKHEIGRGSYGVVKLAYNEQEDRHYAMKALSKKRLFRRAALQARNPKFRKNPFDPLEKLHREIAILKKLNHPNVVRLVEVLDDPNEDNLYLVFELVSQGEVLSIPTDNPLSEKQTWNYFRDTVLGLEYLHFQKVIHRDIKPANLLLDDQGRVKIADFGVSSQFTGTDASLSSCTGTPVFLAPELLEPDPILRTNRPISGKATDIWALGITLFSLLYGTVPWLDNSNAALFKKITAETLKFPEKPVVSPSVKDLISRMLTIDPAKRYSLEKVKEHPWSTGNGDFPLPPLVENCIQITVTDEEVTSAVKHVPRIATLILVKYMLQKGSFRNPFHSDSMSTRRSRSSVSSTLQASQSSMLTSARELEPSGDVFSYPQQREVFLQTPTCNFPNAPEQQNQDTPSIAIGSALLMADAGMRRAFTRTNSVPLELAGDNNIIQSELATAIINQKNSVSKI